LVPALPPRHVTVQVNGVDTHYANGLFFRPATGGYAVVAAPPGLVLHDLPSGAETVTAGGGRYFYYAGNFYRGRTEPASPTGTAYKVVAAPVGAAVRRLPREARPESSGDHTRWRLAGVVYRRAFSGSDVVYRVVEAVDDAPSTATSEDADR
jgi:hypothetical protein